MEEIVKSSEEKFMQSLAKEQLVDQKKPESAKEENAEKTDTVQLMPFELLSSRAPKSIDRGVFAFNVESKMIAENLNERGKQFRSGQKDAANDLETKIPAKSLDNKHTEANLALWGMKHHKTGGEGDVGSFVKLTEERKTADEITDADMEKLSEEMHKERRKKYHQTAIAVLEAKTLGKKSEANGELFDLFRNFVKDGCAITEKESENLQKVLMNANCRGDDATTSEVESKTSCETFQETKKWRKGSRKNSEESFGASKKFPKSKKEEETERKTWKKSQGKQRDLKSKKKHINLEKMKLKMIREALPR